MAIKSWNEMRSLDISKYVKQRDKADYLPWASCLKLLYENGAEKVGITPLTTETGSSLFMSDQIFTDTLGANGCGVRSILVKAIDNHNFWLKARHVLELPFIFLARKRRVAL